MLIIFDKTEAELIKDFTGLDINKFEEKSVIKPMSSNTHCITSKTGDVTISTSDYEAMKIHVNAVAVTRILGMLGEIGVWVKPLLMKLDVLNDTITDMFNFRR